ncbi:MAG: hypothetical protein LCH88_08990 [Proteobacteria bacterium]|nr:hypothetical protein [Pseudomonadota bacterium]
MNNVPAARYRAYVAAWPKRNGEMYPVTHTVSRTAREAREKAGRMWDGGWAYASKKQGWKIVKLSAEIDNG